MSERSPHPQEIHESVPPPLEWRESPELEFVRKICRELEPASLLRYEKEKTKDELLTIAAVDQQLEKFISRYGVSPWWSVHPDRVRLIDLGRYFREYPTYQVLQRRADIPAGVYFSETQNIWVMVPYREGGKLSFVHTVAHECLHANSFQSFQTQPDVTGRSTLYRPTGKSGQTRIEYRRVGFNVVTRDRDVAFRDVDEAVIEELTIRFFNDLPGKVFGLHEEFQRREDFIGQHTPSEQKKLRGTMKSLYLREVLQRTPGGRKVYDVVSVPFAYEAERRDLWEFVDDLVKLNPKGGSREQIFQLFVDAVMHGRLLPVARLVERTFGQGSFRRLGEGTSVQTSRKKAK